MRAWLFPVLTLLLVATARAQPTPTRAPPSGAVTDIVMIVGMTPGSFVDGVETEVEVTVAYELNARPEGLIEIASNTLSPKASMPFASQRIAQGSGTVTLRGKLTPRFWTASIVPILSAHLVVAGEELAQRRSLASDRKAIVVTLRPNAPETYAVNPNPSVVYEDGLRIKSITPEQFVEGQAVDIEVVVSYELLSREEAELGLGFSSRPNAFTTLAKLTLKAGKGEAVLRGRVVPKRTGTLPFAKLQVTLFEFPKRPRSVPLALDSETVEVR